MGNEVAVSFKREVDIRKKLNRLFSRLEWIDENTVIIEEGMLVGSFHFSTDRQNNNFIEVHIEGGSDPERIIKCLCHNYGWLAWDKSDRKFLDLEDCKSWGWNNYLNYLKHIGYMGET